MVRVMRMKYRFPPLSENEKDVLRMVLLDELELQIWYAIVYSDTLCGEQIFYTQ